MCRCIELVNEKLAGYNGAIETNLLSAVPRAMICVCRKTPRGKKPPLLEASYCPFCGKLYRKARREIAALTTTDRDQRHG